MKLFCISAKLVCLLVLANSLCNGWTQTMLEAELKGGAGDWLVATNWDIGCVLINGADKNCVAITLRTSITQNAAANAANLTDILQIYWTSLSVSPNA